MRQVVGAIIQNRDAAFLLQKRTHDAPSFPLHWSLFGGIVDQNETPAAAIRRELDEELRLTDSLISSFSLVQQNSQPNGTEQFIFHIVTTATLQDLTLREGDSMAFVSEHELFERQFAFNIETVLREFLSANEQAA